MRPAPGRRLRFGGAALGARAWSSRIISPASKPNAAYKGSKLVTKLKVMGIQLVSMGLTQPELDTDEVVLFMESRRGIYQKLIIRDDTLDRRDHARRHGERPRR